MLWVFELLQGTTVRGKYLHRCRRGLRAQSRVADKVSRALTYLPTNPPTSQKMPRNVQLKRKITHTELHSYS